MPSTADGYYELARYRFKGNGEVTHRTAVSILLIVFSSLATRHKCITGLLNWHHGTYTVDDTTNSITLTPLGDGYQQIQNTCEAITNFIENYNMTEFYKEYRMFQDTADGNKLHLFDSGGAPLAPMFYRSQTPIMNPTRLLRNVSLPVGPASVKNQKRNAGEVSSRPASAGLVIVALVVALAGSVTGPLFF